MNEEERCKEPCNIPLAGPRQARRARAKRYPYNGNTPMSCEDHRDVKGDSHHHTCFQRRPCRPNEPPTSRRKRSKPTNTMKSNRMSVTSLATRVSSTLLTLLRTHATSVGTHTKRTCAGWNKPRAQNNQKWIFTLAAPVTDHVCSGFLTVCRQKGKVLTLDKERKVSHS